jgi:hypothetical protein
MIEKILTLAASVVILYVIGLLVFYGVVCFFNWIEGTNND